MILEELGWSAFFAEAFEPHKRDGVVPARVAARHHGPCELLTELGPLGGVPAGRLGDDDLPAVGDWVVARPLDGERKALIEAVLPRRTQFVRKEAWRRARAQVIAANIDVVFVVTAFDGDLNPRRLERYLAATWESGAQPVIVVNKVDQAADRDEGLSRVRAVALGVPVLALSAATGDGVDALAAWLRPAQTAALLGSSGVGKSTLVNRLAGRAVMATREIAADGRGRHTTTHRELVPVAGGSLLLDTPGLRELQLWDTDRGLERTFEDISELADRCRFRDCAHEREPGCAVQAALADGSLSPDRFTSWRALQRELRALAVRQDARLRSEEQRRWKRIERAQRAALRKK